MISGFFRSNLTVRSKLTRFMRVDRRPNDLLPSQCHIDRPILAPSAPLFSDASDSRSNLLHGVGGSVALSPRAPPLHRQQVRRLDAAARGHPIRTTPAI
ncbi:hypothetical protein DENSPDRAFT_840829 [Dentipellis sp. KUC8613]|nr:hypothetical protein DENSPDRAFT_840829 [Dentipellis sp. KUC8613]